MLSLTEANNYKGVGSCKPTDYALANGVLNHWNGGRGNCVWWLRGRGKALSDAAVILSSGKLYEIGKDVDTDYCGIRPAMWIDLNS